MSGRRFVISGPSGAGKSSLCAALLQRCPDLHLSVSCTTRAPRAGEADGREYHFLSERAFVEQQEQGAFLEWARVHGNYYGTRLSDVETMLKGGADVLLEIDWQGARQVAERIESTERTFLSPPSLDELRRRLHSRGLDDQHVIERRVNAAAAEMEHAGEAHHQIVNDDFDQALERLVAICSG